MKKHCVRILIAFFGLAALGAAARGQVSDQIKVKIPYEFVVNGKTLPAGTYRVNRAFDRGDRVLVISSFENHVSVLVVPNEVADNTRAEQPAFIFEQVGDEHLLSKIETGEHVFTIPVSSPATPELAMTRHSGPGSSGSK